MKKITQAELKEILNYDSETGVFTWKVDRGGRYKKGMVAGGIDKEGYVVIRVLGVSYPAHRLAWLYIHGKYPDNILDHINRDRKDNRLSNLRDVTKAENNTNQSLTKRNTSGCKGVSHRGKYSKWHARITLKGYTIFLGSYNTKEEAESAYLKASEKVEDLVKDMPTIRRKQKKYITLEIINKIIAYDPVTGIFTWKVSNGIAQKGCQAGNTSRAGYRSITIRGNAFKAHRLAWYIHYGVVPENNIDHINRDRDDNSISNLREVSALENNLNKGLSKQNTSGVKGLAKTAAGSWAVNIGYNGRRIRVGTFSKKEDAIKARKDAEEDIWQVIP
jgi:hypothetical protein